MSDRQRGAHDDKTPETREDDTQEDAESGAGYGNNTDPEPEPEKT